MRVLNLAVVMTALVFSGGCNASEGAPPEASASAQVQGSLFVGNKREDTLSKIDLASGEEVMRVPTCDDPHELSVSPETVKSHLKHLYQKLGVSNRRQAATLADQFQCVSPA